MYIKYILLYKVYLGYFNIDKSLLYTLYTEQYKV